MNERLNQQIEELHLQEAAALADKNPEAQAMVSAALDEIVPEDYSLEEQA